MRKLIHEESIIKHFPFSYPKPELLTVHLQLICLVEGRATIFADVLPLTRHLHCDLRKLLLTIQLWLQFPQHTQDLDLNSLSQCEVTLPAHHLMDTVLQIPCSLSTTLAALPPTETIQLGTHLAPQLSLPLSIFQLSSMLPTYSDKVPADDQTLHTPQQTLHALEDLVQLDTRLSTLDLLEASIVRTRQSLTHPQDELRR